MKNTENKKIIKRQRYYVSPSFQKKFIFKKIALVFSGVVATNGFLYLFLQRQINDAMYRGHINARSTGDVIMTPLFITSVTVFIFSIGASAFLLWLEYNRLNKGLNHFSEGLKEVNKGNLVFELKSDKESDFHQLFEAFNGSVGALKEKINLLKKYINEIELMANNYPQEEIEMQALLKSKIKNMEEAFSVIRLSDYK